MTFLANSMPQPWECHFCRKPVMVRQTNNKDNLAIHHLDGDHGNNDFGNLAAAHHGCHTTHHSLGYKHSDEAREKIRAKRATQTFSDETRRKLGDASRGRVHSAETRQKISSAKTGAKYVIKVGKKCVCGHETTPAGYVQHRRKCEAV